MKKTKTGLTQLIIPQTERTLAAMRAAQLGKTLGQYVTVLVRRDAEQVGLVAFVESVGGAK